MYIDERKKNIISEEMISFYDVDYKNIRTLKKMFPNAKVIYCIRKYDEFLCSWYWKYVQYGGYLKFEQWKKTLEFKDTHFTNYANVIKENFDDCFIYNFYEFKKNPRNIVKKLCNFLNISAPDYIIYNEKRNKIAGTRLQKMLLFHNQFFRTYHNPAGFFPYFMSPLIILRCFKQYLSENNNDLFHKPIFWP